MADGFPREPGAMIFSSGKSPSPALAALIASHGLSIIAKSGLPIFAKNDAEANNEAGLLLGNQRKPA
jgi:hypothetical protein